MFAPHLTHGRRQSPVLGATGEDAARPVRVCFLIDKLRRAGTETQLLALLRNLNRDRVEPYLVLLDGEDAESRALEPDNCPVLRLGVRSLVRPSTAAAAVRFARFLRRERIDVLQTYFWDSTYFGVPVGRLAGVPRVVRTRFNVGDSLTPRHRLLGRLCNRFTDLLIANSEACRDAFRAQEGLRVSRTAVLANGVDLERFPLTGPRPLRTDSPAVGIVANLRPVKAVEVFLKAAALLARAHRGMTFHVAGDGELRGQLEELAARLVPDGRVKFLGPVTDVPGFLRGLDVAVLCSRAEGTSNALLEYMAAGKPVVATAVGGNVHLVEDGVHGLLVPADDAQRLAGAVGSLVADPPLAARLGAAARRRVEAEFSRAAAVRRYEDVYRDLVGV